MKVLQVRRPLQRFALSVWTVSLASAVSFASAQDALTPIMVAKTQQVVSAEISPDGKHVAYNLSLPRTPWEEEDGSSRSELHVLEVESGETMAFITAKSGAGSVHWTPDGRGIAFLAKRDDDEHRSLYVIPLRGGEARRAAKFADRSIGRYAFSPDGSQLALMGTAPESDDRKAEEKKGFKQEIYEEDWRAAELFMATPYDEDTEHRQVDVDGHVSYMVWAPDNRRLALAVAPTSLVDDSYMLKRVRVIDTRDGKTTCEIKNGGKLGTFAWKPDGTGLAIVAAHDEHDGAANRLMWASTASPETMPTEMLGVRERDEHQVSWSSNDRLLVRGSIGAWSTIDSYRFDNGKATDHKELTPHAGPAWITCSVSKDGSQLALVGSSPSHALELFTLNAGSGKLTRHTNSNPWLGDIRLARQEVIRYKARDGLEVEGILIHPRNGQKNAPLIVCVHGGPESHLSNGWMTRYAYPGQVAAAEDYAIFYPNYRGSTGRGLAYLKASQGDPAGKEFDDVVDGVDYLIEIGVADKDKVGVTGGSYGGYATAWFSTYYSERFAAGVMFVGISDKISKVGTTDIADEEFYVHAMKRPWDDWEFFLKRSPIYYADKSKTPLLILHGKEDPRVDPGQSREMYRHVKLRGKAPVRLVLYPGEGHGNRMAAARFDYNLRAMRWFDHYLKGEGGDMPAYELDYESHLGKPSEEETQGM